jgi:Dolichyl-phosphate-mannose-protein mannosyltransferase
MQPRPLASPLVFRLPAIACVRLPSLGEGFFIFALCAALYLALAVVMVLQMNLIVSDAWSRVGNAYYVLYSRDPHLAAIGFVWNPLPSLLLLPLLLAQPLWPPLVEQGFAGNIVSVVAMAGATYQLHGILLDWGLARMPRLLAVALFALHPMIVHYGANGDTEALFLLLLLLATRHFSRWLANGQLAALVVAGLVTGVAYWVRYEAAVAAAGFLAVAAVVSYRKERDKRLRLKTAIADALVAGVPFFAAFTLWGVASWLIVGNPFEQFQSVYGTTAQLETGAVFHDTTATRHEVLFAQWFGLQPLIVPILAGSLLIAVIRRDARWMAPVAVFGMVLAFAGWAWITGRTAGWIRYQIAIVPLASLLAALFVADTWPAVERARASLSRAPARLGLGLIALAGAALPAMLALSLGVAIPATIAAHEDPVAGRGGREQLDGLPGYLLGQEVAEYLDPLNLPQGSVLVDVFLGFPIVLSSDNPRQFVITSDRDFAQVLADPTTFGVTHVLVPPSGGLATLDALNRQWPGVYENGAGLGALVREFAVPTEESPFASAFNPGVVESLRWRLYAVAEDEGPSAHGGRGMSPAATSPARGIARGVGG